MLAQTPRDLLSARRIAHTLADVATPQKWFVAGDVDGFFGLAIDNLIQFLLMIGLCGAVLGFDADLIAGKVLPAAALSVIVGNLWYARQSQRLSAATGRTDVTALPYGINTVSLFAFVFLVMAPIRGEALARGATEAEAAELSWQIGLAACFLSGVIELVGAFVAEWIRKNTPRAALLSTLAGIAISFIAIDFALRTFAHPLIAMLPLGVILAAYLGRARMPFGLPGGLVAVVLGSAAAWVLLAAGQPTPVSTGALEAGYKSVSLQIPIPVIGDLIAGLTHELTAGYLLAVILPMGLFSVLGSLQNIESAEAAGDSYRTAPSLAVNGIGTMVAAVFGSCFPTTIYIGHPGWKELGARSGYSVLNAIFFAVLAIGGLTYLAAALIPIEAGMAILLYIGVVITAQAFQANKREHAPAVAVGLFPAIAAWGMLMISIGVIAGAGGDIATAAEVLADPSRFTATELDGLIAISQGFMLACVIWSAAAAMMIDRDLRRAAVWLAIGGGLSLFGLMHGGRATPSGVVAELGWIVGWKPALGYLLVAGFALLVSVRKGSEGDDAPG